LAHAKVDRVARVYRVGGADVVAVVKHVVRRVVAAAARARPVSVWCAVVFRCARMALFTYPYGDRRLALTGDGARLS
jgi:hypothetical protein